MKKILPYIIIIIYSLWYLLFGFKYWNLDYSSWGYILLVGTFIVYVSVLFNNLKDKNIQITLWTLLAGFTFYFITFIWENRIKNEWRRQPGNYYEDFTVIIWPFVIPVISLLSVAITSLIHYIIYKLKNKFF